MTLVYYLLCTDQLSNDNECSHTSVMVCVILVPKSKSPVSYTHLTLPTILRV